MTGDAWADRRVRQLRDEAARLQADGSYAEIIEWEPAASWARGLLPQPVLKVRYECSGRTLALIVVLPDHYPTFPPYVFAPEESFERHQDPDTGHLCLVRDAPQWDDWQWSPHDDVVALLRDQLPKLLAAQGSDTAALQAEVAAPEPESMYYEHSPLCWLAVESRWEIPADHGQMDVLLSRTPPSYSDGTPVIRGVVAQVRDEEGRPLADADGDLLATHAKGLRLRIPWTRAVPPADVRDAAGFDAWLREKFPPEQQKRTKYEAGNRTHYLSILAILTDEEVRHREKGPTWTFLARIGGRHGPHTPYKPTLVQSVRAGRADLSERIPELSCLADRKVLQVGLGGVGGFIAWEFARAGLGTLELIDGDIVEPANSVRWPLGFGFAGNPKSALADVIRQQHPYTAARGHHRVLGKPTGYKEPEGEWLTGLLQGCDLIVGATGEHLVNLLLADYARRLGIPFLFAHTTYGAWGGMVARIRPDGPCMWCLVRHRADAESGGGDPFALPPSDEQGKVVPTGCSAATFTGAGFDSARIAQPAVQLAVSTLCNCTDGYPQAAWDIATLSLRDATGRLLTPRWDTARLTAHPDCQECAGG